jgi:hypothetical protein
VRDYTDLLAYRTSFQLSKEIFETNEFSQFTESTTYAYRLTAYLTANC